MNNVIKWVCFLSFSISYTQFINAAPSRFAPQALEQDGKVTLTPSFTPDGQTIYFAQSECSPIWQCPQRLKKSTLTSEGWSTPELVALPTNDRVDWPAVTPDGNTLVFSWAAPREDYKNLAISENFDLYTLDLTTPGAVPKPIKGADINRPRAGSVKSLRYVHNEAYPSFTLSGDLYFMTERLDGTGERDIYYAPANGDRTLQTAYPLPAPINSKRRDDGAWVDPEGDIMLLSYDNRGGLGSGDIFVSKKVEGRWQIPVNVGNSVNSPYADFGAKLTPDGKNIIFTSNRPVNGRDEDVLQVWIAPFPQSVLN